VGHEIYVQTDEWHVGSVSIGRWAEMSKLLPLLIDFVNRAMHQEWQPGTARNIVVHSGGISIPPIPPPPQELPASGAFQLSRMLSEEWIGSNEIYVLDPAEWLRLLLWCDFLSGRDGAFSFYSPLATAIRTYFGGAFDR
jgi:hypothetical protein